MARITGMLRLSPHIASFHAPHDAHFCQVFRRRAAAQRNGNSHSLPGFYSIASRRSTSPPISIAALAIHHADTAAHTPAIRPVILKLSHCSYFDFASIRLPLASRLEIAHHYAYRAENHCLLAPVMKTHVALTTCAACRDARHFVPFLLPA